MSMDKVSLSSSVEVPESTPVVIRRNSDDDKRNTVGAVKRSSNPFVAFPSTEELSAEPGYEIPRRHSDDDKRIVGRCGVRFKNSDVEKKTKIEVKNDLLPEQNAECAFEVPRRDSGYVESSGIQMLDKISDHRSQIHYEGMKYDGTRIETLPRRGSDQSSRTSRPGSESNQFTQQANGHTLRPNFDQLTMHTSDDLSLVLQQGVDRKAPTQPQGILRRGSGPDQTTDGPRRNSGPKISDDIDSSFFNDAPRRPSVHFADMPRRNSDPKEKNKEQFPDTLRRSSEPEQGYLEHRKAWQQFPEVDHGDSEYSDRNAVQFPDVVRRASEPKHQAVFPEPMRRSIGSIVQNVGVQVDSGVQTPEALPSKDSYLESVGVQANFSRRGSRENRDNSVDSIRSDSNVAISASGPKIDERLAQRRRSLVPMSSMEEESLRERLHMAHLRCCSEIVLREQRYSRETFRKLFQNKTKHNQRKIEDRP
ncbi:unnamed protein product [Acanthoscelides obtectus]|uniref:Uncharacterized protein n=1 Tax=Acanthoscelides obtectus TaxID=200917 RepID=A0A9P0PFB2_ACAOB|nr:unnamed protein product [Acanthoscelides obtectus]CAK1643984.1 hypothetical protein AOBTE_LOCUS13764 [Acanthoscelides obtectus]